MGMLIDKYVNRVLRRFWPEDAKGNRKVWFHSQNLNEDRNGEPKGLPYEGRCWLHSPLGVFAFSWHFWSTYSLAAFDVQADAEDGGIKFHTKLIPVAFWLTLPVPLKRWKEKYGYSNANFIDISLSNDRDAGDVSLRWQFGGDTMSWSSRTPKWKRGHFSFTDFFLGKRTYTEGEPEVRQVKIPMPEGLYDATVEMRIDRWKRPRWFPLELQRASIDVPIGIPYPGKGENSWDCGEDGSYGLSCTARSPEEAIGKLVGNVLETRRKRGASLTEYPPPAVRAVDVAKKRAEAAKHRETESAEKGPRA